MRKQTRRKVWALEPPPGLRPKLTRSQVIDLGLAHLTNVDAIASGKGTPEILWQLVGGAYTWLTVAQWNADKDPARYGDALQAMQAMVVCCGDVAERFKRTGRVGFSGPEYTVAREAVEWMDALAEVVDRSVAVLAAEAGEAAVCNRMMLEVEGVAA